MISVEQRNEALDWIANGLKAGELSFPLEARDFQPSDWAFVLEALPHEPRLQLWEQVADQQRNAILTAMRGDARCLLVSDLPAPALQRLARSATADQLIEIVPDLPKRTARLILQRLDADTRQLLFDALEYGDNQAGRFVNHEIIVYSDTSRVGDLLDDFQDIELPSYTDSFLLVDEGGFYRGMVNIDRLLKSDRALPASALVDDDSNYVSAEEELFEAATAVKKSGRTMLPVLEDDGFLLGRFTLKDAIDVFQEYYEAQFSHLGRVSDEDLFAPVGVSARRRAVWLGINLVTAFMASAVIGVFEDVLAQVVALAVLMPIVASMGGIAGSQTLTLTIRGLATDQLASSNLLALGDKELRIALINGLLWALVVAAGAGLWFGSTELSMIIALALVVNILIAAFSGVLIPVLMDRAGIDPALAGSVVLTTVTDVVGFFVFLGTASILFL